MEDALENHCERLKKMTRRHAAIDRSAVAVMAVCATMLAAIQTVPTAAAFQPQSFSRNGNLPMIKSVRRTRASSQTALRAIDKIAGAVSSSSAASFDRKEYASLLKLGKAHGHSNPFFGPPDPHLDGHSIVPTTKALTDMGLPPPSSVQDMIPDASPQFQQAVEKAVTKGFHVIDGAKQLNAISATHLPGFAETKGILPQPMVLQTNLGSWLVTVKSVATTNNVLDKLPLAAVAYVLVEFFILRPGVDLYKEDIEEDPAGVLVETSVSLGVRLFVVSIIGILTTIIFK